MEKRVAVVTGANKGIGFGLVKALCQMFEGDVILTARDVLRGKSAVESLTLEGLHPKFHQLDVADIDSIVRLKVYLTENYGGLDILINNAGIYRNVTTEDAKSFAENVEDVIEINYFGSVNCFTVLRPLLRPHARVCNVSSMYAPLTIKKCSSYIVSKLIDPGITLDQLSAVMKDYVQSAKDGSYLERGYTDEMYGFSKVGLSVATAVQQRELDTSGAVDVLVNSCCPGYVKTDMNKLCGHLTVEEGIVNPLYCVMLPPNVNSPRGQMLRNKEPFDWVNYPMKSIEN
ncbi:carbonyl reductase [NADPH] 3-like [Biomphalaria glabrata]|uniref:Carbonyl reductase [NADPH] 3-like n=1 Tax=Biomphalaria glabrata TaxID=6526 RepID=A0A9W3B7Z2_BIOGL|nr:carbonyl reductase [NADPH] 3-like [Biomphalaria glabrata]